MKVSKATARLVRSPAFNPLIDSSLQEKRTREFVTLELNTDEGITGVGLTFFGEPLSRALKEAVDALSQLVIGENPIMVKAIVAKLLRTAENSGPEGIATLALSAIDIALWDIKGKALNQPVSALLGGFRDRAPVYASGALTRAMDLQQLAGSGPHLVQMGFKQMKIQLGAEARAAQEEGRVRVVREAVGDDIDLMCDINQLWTVKRAIELGRRLEPYHLFWLEDVVAHDDVQGQATVARALSTPLCAGEYHYGIAPFRHMLKAGAIDIVMIDLLRVGGITQFRKVAAMAEAHNLPVVSHMLPEVNVHLISAIPNGLTVEYLPSTLHLFKETPLLQDGMIVVPNKPGLGLEFDQAAIKRYQVG